MSQDYLLKTEPSEYSFADLQRDNVAIWDGVTNPTALKNLREMQPGVRREGTVAIKILPEQVSETPFREQRFQRLYPLCEMLLDLRSGTCITT